MPSLQERFEAKYIPEPNSGCWLWFGAANPRGYGMIHRGGTPTKWVQATAISWELYRGPVPAGVELCHKCDVPECVNPDHLFLGTRLQNMRDAKAKGRNAKGSSHGAAKLTEDDVRAIRHDARSQHAIARAYGVAVQTINVMLQGKTWKHVI